MKLKYKHNEFEVCKCDRTIEQEAKEIQDRLTYFYMKTNNSMEFETAHESQVYPLVLDLINKIFLKSEEVEK